MIDRDDLVNRITYHTPSQEGIARIQEMRQHALEWSLAVRRDVTEGREQSLAFTKIEEALFWANAGIARAPEYQEE